MLWNLLVVVSCSAAFGGAAGIAIHRKSGLVGLVLVTVVVVGHAALTACLNKIATRHIDRMMRMPEADAEGGLRVLYALAASWVVASGLAAGEAVEFMLRLWGRLCGV